MRHFSFIRFMDFVGGIVSFLFSGLSVFCMLFWHLSTSFTREFNAENKPDIIFFVFVFLALFNLICGLSLIIAGIYLGKKHRWSKRIHIIISCIILAVVPCVAILSLFIYNSDIGYIPYLFIFSCPFYIADLFYSFYTLYVFLFSNESKEAFGVV